LLYLFGVLGCHGCCSWGGCVVLRQLVLLYKVV
jgi:hypothetical protein